MFLKQIILALVVFFACSIYAFSADVTWSGSGGWSTSANWSSGSVPTSSDRVIFDSTSTASCTINTNVDVVSIFIDTAYTGSIYGGSSVISINTGNFDVANSAFVAQSSTIKFTGTGRQILDYPKYQVFNIVENANVGGELRMMRWRPLTINTLKIGAGTETYLLANSRTLTVTNLIINGTSGNIAKVHSYKTGLLVSLDVQGSQSISYASFQDIEATGQTIDGTNNCIDLGNNLNIDFTPAGDTTPPVITPLTPTAGSEIDDKKPLISASVSDVGSGIDPSTLVMTVKGKVVPAIYDSGEVSYMPSKNLKYGVNEVVITISDLEGNSAMTSWSFEVEKKSKGHHGHHGHHKHHKHHK